MEVPACFHCTAQALSIPKKPLQESGNGLGARDVLAGSVDVVEEKVMGSTLLEEICHQV